MEIMEIYLLRWPENWRLRLKRAAMPWLFQGREITSEIEEALLQLIHMYKHN